MTDTPRGAAIESLMSTWIYECPDPTYWQNYIQNYSARQESGCIEWKGALNRGGYGRTHWREDGHRRMTSASRMAYLAFVGPIPFGMVPDHLCHNRACVNVQHLEAVTFEENLQRRRQRKLAERNPRSNEPTQFGPAVARVRREARVIELNPRLAHLAELVA